MKYCHKCGAELHEEANFCTKCGSMVNSSSSSISNDDPYEESFSEPFDEYGEKKTQVENLDKKHSEYDTTSEGSKGLGIAIMIFAVLGCFWFLGQASNVIQNLSALGISYSSWYYYAIFTLIPLVWQIPMTVKIFKHIKARRSFTKGFCVCTLLFLNLIAGILMFCYKPNGNEK